MDKLKPCPFCGHEAMISYNSNYDFQAYCTNDACFMSQIIMEDMETEEQARAAWNTRTPAVPLEPLAKWIVENLDPSIDCKTCAESPRNYECACLPCPPMTEKQVKEALEKWMEEQDADRQ